MHTYILSIAIDVLRGTIYGIAHLTNCCEDTINLIVTEQRAGLSLTDVQNVCLGNAVVREHQIAPRLQLLGSGVTVGLDCEERREVVLPWPLEPATGQGAERRHINHWHAHRCTTTMHVIFKLFT